jgi:adenylate kinase
MFILLVGAPGAGKGTHGGRIAAKRAWTHVSSGELLREAVEKQTSLGREAEAYMKAGALVPDGIMLRWIEELLEDPANQHGVVLDGFPRTVPQAKGLDRLLERHGLTLDRVLYFDITEEAAVERLATRVSCTGCGMIYNMATNPPEDPHVCRRCGGRLEIRGDDAAETIRARFEEFRRLTEPMIEYYRDSDKLSIIDTAGSIDEVGARVTMILDRLVARRAFRDATG